MHYIDGFVLFIILSIFAFITIRGILKLRAQGW